MNEPQTLKINKVFGNLKNLLIEPKRAMLISPL